MVNWRGSGRGRTWCSTITSGRRRGYYRVGPLFVETGDYFGILRRFVARPPLHYLTVYPDVLPVGRLLVPTSRPVGEVRAPWAVVEDVSRPAGVREYQRGDPLRRIHWKATAHTGRLHSRVYEYTRLQGASIVVDFHRDTWRGDGGDEAAELAITTAASIAAHLRERHQQFGLVSNGLDGAKMIDGKKIRPGDVLGALTGEAGFTREQVGKITVTDMSTYVAVTRDIAREAVKRLSAGKVKGKTVKVRALED